MRKFIGAGLVVMLLAVLAPLGVVPESTAPASATVYDASSVSLKFKQANRVAITSGGTGKAVGDIMKYTDVATINGVVVDAVIKTVALSGVSLTKYDEGSAVTSAPPGSTQAVDDLFMSDINGSSGTESMVTYEFSFYEGGTYTGVGSGVPVTLANVAINSYDIDGLSGVKQFIDFRGFQSYKSYSESSTKGLDASDKGAGLVRFVSRDGSLNVSATSGSYSFSRVQVNYDQISTLTVRIGELGGGTAYFALDFSAGGTWTTNGTTAVTPTLSTNPFNAAPTTADITTFFAAQDTGYVFRASDFPYSDVENNAFASLKVATLPTAGTLEFYSSSGWVPVSAGDIITVSDLDLGKLRLSPAPGGGSFTFEVNDGLAFSTPATLTFTTATTSQTISFPSPGSQNGATQQVFASNAIASSGLTPTLTSLSTGVCTVSGLTITTAALPAGVTSATCVVIASQDGDANYGRAEAVTQQFAVTTLLGQSITFTNPGDREFSGATISTDAATTAPARSVTLTSLTLGVCTISGTSIVPVSIGLCSVRATQPGDATYAAASPVTRSFNLTRASQTITFAQPATQAISTASIAVSPTASSGLAVTLASSTTGVCTVSSFTVTLVAAGTCTLTASQAGNGTWLAAPDVTRSFAVFAITTASLTDGQVGTPYSQTVALAGAAGGGTWAALDTLPSGLSLDATTGELSGTPTATSTGSYRFSYTEDSATHTVTLALTIVGAAALTPQTITFSPLATQPVGAMPFTVGATADSGLTPTIVSTTPAVCTFADPTVTIVGAGLCSLTASQPGDSTYAAATDVTRTFRVIEITTSSLPNGTARSAYSATYALAGAAGGGTWAATSSLPAGLTLDPATGELHGTPTSAFTGAVEVTYTEDGATVTSSLSLTVDAAAPLTQTITFAQPSTLAISTASVVLAPSTDATGLTPSLASSTTAVCTVSGFTVTIVATGLCTLTASQPGDATYSAAADVTRSFRIIGITTSSLPGGTAGSAYATTYLATGGVGGGTWAVVGGLPNGLGLNPSTGMLSGTPTAAYDLNVTVSYTEGGATHTRTLRIVIAAASVAPVVQRATSRDDDPAPAAAPVATPKPRTPVLGATVKTPKPATSTNTVDLGSGSQVAAAGVSADQLGSAKRTVTELQSETISGYAPGTTARVDVLGAKTLATIAVGGGSTLDATMIAKAARDAAGGDRSNTFAVLTGAEPLAAADAAPPTTARIPSSDKEYFTLATLDSPVTLGSLATDTAKSWVHFSVQVTGYKPGSTVYLAMTSTPVVFASTVVGKDGTALVEGDMAMDVLPAGVHHLRVVGDREIGAVSVDATGAIVLTAAQLDEIQKFDQGTDAAVRLSGDNTLGGSQLAVRIIPLDLQAPWWLLWALGALALLLVASRLARVLESTGWAWTKRAVLVVATAAPVAAGLLLDVPLLAILAGAVLVVGLVLAMALPRLRDEPYDDEWESAAYKRSWATA